MTLKIFFRKIKNKLWSTFVALMCDKNKYLYIYRSYWHYLIHKETDKINVSNYFTAPPNQGAGIGHQMANWIAGYWWAHQLNLKFAHIPFSTKSWDDFLGFGEDEITVEGLIKTQGYKKVLLPLFDENKPNEINRVKAIINSYVGQKIVFVAEKDQGYTNQFGVKEIIKTKFDKAKARKNQKLIYSKDTFNIAVHVRRGDIVIGQSTKNPNLLMRWQEIDYFKIVLKNVVENIKIEKSIAIYLFSQGVRTNFSEFEEFENIHFCLDMNPQDSFLHMVYADLLITSKSSFSYKPALMNDGIKVCPRNFWHGYPNGKDWILVEDDGSFETNKLKNYE